MCIYSVSEITEDLEYKVTFKSGGHEFDLIVTLSKDFPNDKPNLRISPIVIHPWVDVNGEITSAPGLLNVNLNNALCEIMFILEKQKKMSSNYFKT